MLSKWPGLEKVRQEFLDGDLGAALDLVRLGRVGSIRVAVERFVPVGQLTPARFDALADAVAMVHPQRPA